MGQILEDISGNTFVSNPNVPTKDGNCDTTLFVRTTEQDHALGIYQAEGGVGGDSGTTMSLPPTKLDLEGEVLTFNTNCPSCAAPCETHMKLTSILILRCIQCVC